MGFLAWIKNGAKGTYGLQMPAFFPASRTTYDNSNSGLSADKVQGAIDEVVNGTVLATVTADGVKTNKELINELVTATTHAKLTLNSRIVINNGVVLRLVSLQPSYAQFSLCTGTDISVSVMSISAYMGSSTTWINMNITTGGNTLSDVGGNVRSAGSVLTLYK